MTFRYRARDLDGRCVSGVLEAPTMEAAGGRLQEYFASVETVRPWGIRSGRPSTRSLALFFRQLSFQLSAGIPIHRAVEICMYGDDPVLDHYLWQIADRIRCGWSLSKAMEEQEQAFSQVAVSVVKVGEETGRLPGCLQRLSDALARSYGLRQKLVSDLTYPMSVALMSVVLLGGMALFALPRMEEVFAGMRVPMPWLTRVVLAVFHLVTHPATLVVGALALAGMLLWVRQGASRQRNVMRVLEGHASRMKVVGPLLEDWWLAIVLDNLATVLDSGVPLLEGMALLSSTSPSPLVSERLDKARLELVRGSTLTDAFRAHRVVPHTALSLIAAGESAGRVVPLLRQAVAFYERQLEYRLEVANAMLGPMLLMGLGIMIGVLSVAMLLPFFSVISEL